MKENDLPYRDAAAVMLLNGDNKVFVALRIDNAAEAWQMPQGGLEEGEAPEAGMLRELEEETSIRPDLVRVIARARRTLFYDLPEDLVGKVWKGKYRGQRQHWFLARFLGTDADVNLETAEPEFRGWRWAEPAELPRIIVPFKRRLYEDVLEEFADHL
ncbi:RNA pyrophosphohydrolase [Edaphosphingomonas haloaromaticamans]|uniref:RNA pyrophosphohydrolase n=1 Tax=Edaphosphingomonas haloaromaticamans TaxID=653954 RepID=A0A1S1HDL2_9SPHN|nr:RNA pyrophosphohydrolase [Sphingomonas haloaromaticamans]OHT19611.1 RNA pyrophosphohydrolase [Sphingomonas haloaromaticamans]